MVVGALHVYTQGPCQGELATVRFCYAGQANSSGARPGAARPVLELVVIREGWMVAGRLSLNSSGQACATACCCQEAVLPTGDSLRVGQGDLLGVLACSTELPLLLAAEVNVTGYSVPIGTKLKKGGNISTLLAGLSEQDFPPARLEVGTGRPGPGPDPVRPVVYVFVGMGVGLGLAVGVVGLVAAAGALRSWRRRRRHARTEVIRLQNAITGECHAHHW